MVVFGVSFPPIVLKLGLWWDFIFLFRFRFGFWFEIENDI